MPKKTDKRLVEIRVAEGWKLKDLASAAGICPATLRHAENGEPVREYIWGKILKGINSLDNKTRTYTMSDILP
jgi:transcriptional regulator with XRE-family HTH domain